LRRWLVASKPVDDRLEFPRWVIRGFSRDLALISPTSSHPHTFVTSFPSCSMLLQCSLLPVPRGKGCSARTIDNVWHVLGVGSVWLPVASESPGRKGRGLRRSSMHSLVSLDQHAASSDNRLAGWFPMSLDARFQLLDLSASALSFNSSADLDVVYDRVRQYGSFLTHRNLSLSPPPPLSFPATPPS
jgi:hypothetical protein